MRKLLFFVIFLIVFAASSCKYEAGTFEGILTMIDNWFKQSHSIEKDGLEGVDTIALPGDKEQIAASFIANIDSAWTLLKESRKGVSDYPRGEFFFNDPTRIYKSQIRYEPWNNPYVIPEILPDRPKEVYKGYTDLVVYSRNKLLCWAFVVLKKENKDSIWKWYDAADFPMYMGFNVIGKRNHINEPFKIFVRNRHQYAFNSENIDKVRIMANETLYIPGFTYDLHDVYKYQMEDEDKLPVLSDPDFFEKHPLFKKFNDSTYNFEWYNANAFSQWLKDPKDRGTLRPVRYTYPY
ncbi:MAG: hypothetical protein K2M12_07355 [Muribaculaceae bacterium]|nr:hypothetical protein [Muribaculaceae bacterium]